MYLAKNMNYLIIIFISCAYIQKPYACTYPGCEKRYTDPSSLRKHTRSHAQKKKVIILAILLQYYGFTARKNITALLWFHCIIAACGYSLYFSQISIALLCFHCLLLLARLALYYYAFTVYSLQIIIAHGSLYFSLVILQPDNCSTHCIQLLIVICTTVHGSLYFLCCTWMVNFVLSLNVNYFS